MDSCRIHYFRNHINVGITGNNMNKRKLTFLGFFVVVVATTIIVFNNTMDVLEKLFNPDFNPLMMISLLLLVLPTIYYVVYTWRYD
jgi:hypothetical protein